MIKIQNTTPHQDRPKKSSGGLYKSSLPIVQCEISIKRFNVFQIKERGVEEREGTGGGSPRDRQHANLRRYQNVENKMI